MFYKCAEDVRRSMQRCCFERTLAVVRASIARSVLAHEYGYGTFFWFLGTGIEPFWFASRMGNHSGCGFGVLRSSEVIHSFLDYVVSRLTSCRVVYPLGSRLCSPGTRR